MTPFELRNEIDRLREEATRLAAASNSPEGPPPNREMLRARLREVEEKIDKLLVQHLSAEEVESPKTPFPSMAGDFAGRLEQIRALVETWPDVAQGDRQQILDIIDGKVTGRPEKTPADRLADAVDLVLEQPGMIPSVPRSRCAYLKGALDEYRSTRNGNGQTTAETFGSPPDPIFVARFMLDSLTGGALSSLICALRDDLGSPRRRGFDLDSLKSNLRALGEKLP